jgi:hypothetical protein
MGRESSDDDARSPRDSAHRFGELMLHTVGEPNRAQEKDEM